MNKQQLREEKEKLIEQRRGTRAVEKRLSRQIEAIRAKIRKLK